jgi:hypothetical protein
MPDLREMFSNLDQLGATDLTHEIESRSQMPEPAPPREPASRRLAAGLVATVLAVAVALFAWSVLRPLTSSLAPTTPSPEIAGLWADLGRGLTELPPPPVARRFAVNVWTGRALIVWGGNEGSGDPPHADDGYAFDVETRRWSSLAPSPLQGRSWSAGVWTGEEVVIWGGATGSDPTTRPFGDGAAYDPASGSWRRITPAPVAANSPLFSVWTGRELVVWGSYRTDGSGTGAAYDPVTDTWRTVPDPPILLNDGTATWTGTEMVVVGAQLQSGNHSPTETAIGAAYDPMADTWRSLPAAPLSPQSNGVAWNGTEVIGVDYDRASAVYSPITDQWSPFGRLPSDSCEGGLTDIVSVGNIVVTDLCGSLMTRAPGDDRWQVAEQLFPYGDIVAAGGVALLLYDPGTGRRAMAAFRPAEPAAGASLENAEQVATAFAALRSGYPFSRGAIPADVEREMQALLSVEGRAAWSRKGMSAFWAYYPGFNVVSVTEVGGGFEANIQLSGESGVDVDEVIVMAPGMDLDGVERDLVIVDAHTVQPV